MSNIRFIEPLPLYSANEIAKCCYINIIFVLKSKFSQKLNIVLRIMIVIKSQHSHISALVVYLPDVFVSFEELL